MQISYFHNFLRVCKKPVKRMKLHEISQRIAKANNIQANQLDRLNFIFQAGFRQNMMLKNGLGQKIYCKMSTLKVIRQIKNEQEYIVTDKTQNGVKLYSEEPQNSFKVQGQPNEQNIILDRKQYFEISTQYMDYNRIQQENKQKLQLIQENNKQNKHDEMSSSHQIQKQEFMSFPFSQEYIKQNILKTKYFYGDLIVISGEVIDHLLKKIHDISPEQYTAEETVGLASNGSGHLQAKIKYEQDLVEQTYLHFLIYTYLLYNKQLRGFKGHLYQIVEYYLNHCLYHKEQSLNILDPHNLEFLMYLRKFIQSQSYFGQGSKILVIQQKVCQLLKKSYQEQKKSSQKIQIQTQIQTRQTFSSKMVQRIKLVQKYTLAFPNVWVLNLVGLSKGHGQNPKSHLKTIQQNNVQNLHNSKANDISLKMPLKVSQSIILQYDYFAEQFKVLIQQLISFWVDFQELTLSDSVTLNFSKRRFLSQQFRRLNINTCFNHISLIFNRLHVIIELPKTSSDKNSQNNGYKRAQDKEVQACIQNLFLRFKKNKINLLTYLPCQKLQSGEQVKFMRIMILLRNIFTYHTLRNVDRQLVGQYLQSLFQNNNQHIIKSKDVQKRREIKFLIGQLVSKLTSGLWFDEEDVLGKYFETINYNTFDQRNEGKRDNFREWHSTKHK